MGLEPLGRDPLAQWKTPETNVSAERGKLDIRQIVSSVTEAAKGCRDTHYLHDLFANYKTLFFYSGEHQTQKNIMVQGREYGPYKSGMG